MTYRTKVEAEMDEFNRQNGRGSLLAASAHLKSVIAILLDYIEGLPLDESESEPKEDVPDTARWTIPADPADTPDTKVKLEEYSSENPGRGTEVETLPSSDTTEVSDDLKYFEDKVKAATDVPEQEIPETEDQKKSETVEDSKPPEKAEQTEAAVEPEEAGADAEKDAKEGVNVNTPKKIAAKVAKKDDK